MSSSTLTASRGAVPRVPPFEAALLGLAGVLLASGVAHLVVQLVAGGPWTGPVSWRKPATFGLSFGLVLATTVWAAGLLDLPGRVRRLLLGAFGAASAGEVTVITVQAWRGVPSHFNTTTPLNAVFAMSAAAGGALLIAVSVVLAVVSWRRPAPGLDDATILALRVGLSTFLLALATGAAMIAEGVTTQRTVSQAAAYLAPGWLKPVHAVWMHGTLVLLAVAWLGARRGWTRARRLQATRVAAAAYVAAGVAVSVAVLATR